MRYDADMLATLRHEQRRLWSEIHQAAETWFWSSVLPPRSMRTSDERDLPPGSPFVVHTLGRTVACRTMAELHSATAEERKRWGVRWSQPEA